MDWALLATSAALVIVTVVYTIHTRAMAAEMRSSRELSVQPRLALDIQARGPTFGVVRLTNIGAGPAVDVRLRIEIAPLDDRRTWTSPLMRPGDYAEFFLRKPEGGSLDLPAAMDAGVVVALNGAAQDVYGTEHRVSDRLDVADWWRTISEADQAFVEPSLVKIEREIEKLRREAERIRHDFPRQLAAAISRED